MLNSIFRISLRLFTFLFVFVACEKNAPDGTSGATLPVDTAEVGDHIRFPDVLLEYKPAPGQFINKSPALMQNAESIIGKKGLVTLGGWGGYIVVGFNKAIVNHADNPYGVDFTVIGNAYEGSSEPGIVMVMQDENANARADDTWYELQGSLHDDKSTIHHYEMTYYYVNDSTVRWKDNQGESDTLLRNGYHLQSYYPMAENYPDMTEDSLVFSGTRLASRSVEDVPGHWVNPKYGYGYADNLSVDYSEAFNLPDNPQTPEREGCGGDAFDLDWAVDAEGNAVKLDSVHFIKIYSAVHDANPVIGEVSTEVQAIVSVR